VKIWRLLLHPREFTMQLPRVGRPVSLRAHRLESPGAPGETRMHGLEGGGAGNSTGSSYPYPNRSPAGFSPRGCAQTGGTDAGESAFSNWK